MKKLAAAILLCLLAAASQAGGLNLGIINAYKRNLGPLKDKIEAAKATAVPSMTPSASPSITSTGTATVTPTPSATPSVSVTFTPTFTASATSTCSPTETPTSTITQTSSATPSVTPTATITMTSTSTPTFTPIVSVFVDGLANSPTGICVDSHGTVYWVDSVSGNYYTTGTAGVIANPVRVASMPGMTPVVRGITVDPAGNVYTMLRKQGATYSGMLVKNTTPLTDFVWGWPLYLGMSADATTNRIYLRSYGGVGYVDMNASMWQTPVWIWQLTDGSIDGLDMGTSGGGICHGAGQTLYTTDYAKQRAIQFRINATVTVTPTMIAVSGFNYSVRVATSASVTAASLVSPTGVALDDAGNLYYSTGSGVLFKQEPGSGLFTQYSDGSGSGNFSDVCYDPVANSLYVADYTNRRIMKIRFQ